MRIRRSMLCVLACGAALGLSGCNRAADDWKTVQAADTAESYQQFLKQHGDSEFAAKAQERVKQLAEDREWQSASGTDSKEAYEQFLAQHADSKWAPEARTRLENFQAGTAGAATADAPAVAASGDAARSAGDDVPAAAAPVATKPAAPAAHAPAAQAAEKTAPARDDKPLRVASIAAGSHYAQLGAFSSRERAEKEWRSLHGRFGELGGLEPHYTTGKSGSQLVYRLQVDLGSAEKVQALCDKLKKRSQGCIAVRG